MPVISCPTTAVAAPAERVWQLFDRPESYQRWAGVELVHASPPGPVQAGQVIEFRTRELGRWWRVLFQVRRVDEPDGLVLDIRLPLGVVNHEHVVLSPIDGERTRVTLN